MNWYIVIIIILAIFIVWMVKYLEKKLPERDKRKKEEWEQANKNKINYAKKQKKHDEEIEKIKTNRLNKEKYYANVKKGKKYEEFIAKYFESKGYKVTRYGLKKGKKDKGIDLIIMKNKIVTLVQCKNWEKAIIKDKNIKEFIGNATAFLENHENREKIKNYEIKRLLVISNDTLSNSAKYFLKDTRESVEYLVIPIENNS